MRDRDIRESLRRTELAPFLADAQTRVVEELGIMQGDFRIDMAVVNGVLHGWEIKSDYDTLARLPAQAQAYGEVFDEMTIVVGTAHTQHVREIVPAWWGILQVRNGKLRRVRAGRPNRTTKIEAVVQLLWRDEAVAILDRYGLAKGLRSSPRRALWQALVSGLPRDVLAYEVREAIKVREGWKEEIFQASHQ